VSAMARCPGGCGQRRAVVTGAGAPRVESHLDAGWLCWGGVVGLVAWTIGRRVFRRWRAAR
jgi:hypothetical protein